MNNKRIKHLVQEVVQGEYKKDQLLNSSYPFSEERQAAYFSHARNNMFSDMAYAVMYHNQQIDDLKVKEVLKNHGKLYESHVQCNERIMLGVLLDYFADIYRLKDFHGITYIRSEKIIAYTVSWIVRRKPLQYIHDTDEEKDIFVNERFATFLLLNECLLCGEKYISQKHKDRLDEYLDLLLYYFKYRECNPQVFELAIESFKMGMLVE